MRRFAIALAAAATLAAPLSARERPDRPGGTPRPDRTPAADRQAPRGVGDRPDANAPQDRGGPARAGRGPRDRAPDDVAAGTPRNRDGRDGRGIGTPSGRVDSRSPGRDGPDGRGFGPALSRIGSRAPDGFTGDRPDTQRGRDGRGFGPPPGRGDSRVPDRRVDPGRFTDDTRPAPRPGGGYGGRFDSDASTRAGSVDHGWRGDDRHAQGGRRGGDCARLRAGRYVPPPRAGGYRHRSIGGRIAPAFLAHDYWLDDAGGYGLPPASGTCRWVRYYDDVLLVDLRTGAIADMIPAFFL